MKSLNIDTGVVEYTLNDAVTVSFNPTDISFIENLYKNFEELDAEQEQYKKDIDAAKDNVAVFKVARDADAKMRARVDSLFGVPVCEPLLGTVSIYAMSDGLPIWANLFLAIMDEIDTSYTREQKATNPRLQKYLKKYNKK